MQKEAQCQSCGMTFDKKHQKFIAKEQDGSASIYCSYCYKDGEFLEPEATMNDMIEVAVPYFTQKMGSEQEARAYLTEVIKNLSRWKD
jgi:NAD-dependent SIR2 family protein deacetylase